MSVDSSASSRITTQAFKAVVMGSIKTSNVLKSLDAGCRWPTGRENNYKSQWVRSQKTYVQKNALSGIVWKFQIHPFLPLFHITKKYHERVTHINCPAINRLNQSSIRLKYTIISLL